MPKVVLHQYEISPFCNKIRRCLKRKGLEWETVDYNGVRSMQALRLTKVGMLPVLDYDGERTQDSMRIAQFLDRKHPERPLYPADPARCAQARMWEDWAEGSLFFYELQFRFVDARILPTAAGLMCVGRPAWEYHAIKMAAGTITRKKVKQQGLGRLAPEEIDRRFFEILGHIDGLLATQPWLVAGDEPTIADYSVAGQLGEMLRTSLHAPRMREHRHFADWIERC